MIDHISLRVGNLQKSRDFYAAALAPLGYGIIYDIKDVEAFGMGITGCSLGEGKETRLWLDGAGGGAKTHIAFAAKDRKEVDAAYEAAIAAGGIDNGKPGVRKQYSPTYYGAFFIDPDGNTIEIVHRG